MYGKTNSTINSISMPVNNFNFTSVFFRYNTPHADNKHARSSSYTSIHLLQKFLNTSANNNGSLCTYRS